MLAANNSMGPPPTLLTVNGIISGPQIPPPGMMNGPHSGVSRPNLNSHLFTPTFYPQNTAFTSFSPVPFCGAGSQLLPCITPSNGTLFTQGPTNPFSFNTNGSMMVSQPQSFVNFSPFNQNNSSTTTVVLAAPDICNNSGAGSVLPPCFSPLYTNLQPISSSAPILPVFSVSGSSNGLLTMPITHSIESPVPLTCATPLPKISEAITPVALKCKVEVPNSKLMTSTTSSGGNTNGSANMIVLENAEFHRGIILEAIDKLRERKARPDSERISRLLRLQHNISRIETQLCLSRLAETGSIVCVDYKGNLSYRNPSKWRKTAASTAGVMNLPSISRRLVEAIHCLAAEPDASMCQGVTLFQIESVIQNQQLQNLNSSGDSESRVNALTASVVPDLSGPTLRVCLEREATYGKLAKLHDGRYILDENGERKRSQGVGVNNQFTSPLLLNKKPIPHNGKICGNTNQMIGGGYGKPPIAPAIDSNLKLTSPKTPGMINIAPGINGRTLALRRPPNPGKRGRPLGTKSKKIVPAPSQPHILPAPMENGLLSEKRTKLENIGITPQSTISGFVPINIKSEYVPLSLPQMNPCQMPPCLSTVGPTGPMVFPGIYNMTHTNVFALSNDPLTANRFQDPDSSCLSDASFSMAPQMQSTAPLEHTILQTLNADDEVFSIEEIDETIETSRKVYVPEGAGCCRCQDPETQEERFLICKNCGLQDFSSALRPSYALPKTLREKIFDKHKQSLLMGHQLLDNAIKATEADSFSSSPVKRRKKAEFVDLTDTDTPNSSADPQLCRATPNKMTNIENKPIATNIICKPEKMVESTPLSLKLSMDPSALLARSTIFNMMERNQKTIQSRNQNAPLNRPPINNFSQYLSPMSFLGMPQLPVEAHAFKEFDFVAQPFLEFPFGLSRDGQRISLPLPSNNFQFTGVPSHSQVPFSVNNLPQISPISQASQFMDPSRSRNGNIQSFWLPNQSRPLPDTESTKPTLSLQPRIHPYRAPSAQLSGSIFDTHVVRNKLIKALLNNQQTPINLMKKKNPSQSQYIQASLNRPVQSQVLPTNSEKHPKLMGFYTPDTNPAEEFLWDSNFFGCQSVPQLTYTLIYLMGKILGLRTGPQLMQFRLGANSQFRLIPLKQVRIENDPIEYDLLYKPGTEAILSYSQDGMMYVDGKRLPSLAEMAQHTPRLQKQRGEYYFLSWLTNAGETGFRGRHLDQIALSTIIRNIQATLWNVLHSLELGVNPLQFAFGNPLSLTRLPSPEKNAVPFNICKVHQPLDLSVRSTYGAHPKCLDFWPEVTERARQEAWQCADCKSCSVCKDKNAEEVIFICDACDKGFHGACHAPPVSPEADQNLPWVCSTCQAEGYRVQLPTTLMSEPRPLSFDKPPPNESLQSNNVITPPKSLSPPKEISLVTPCVKTTHPGISTSQPQTPAVVDEYSKRSSSSYDPMILSNSIDTSDIGLSEIPASDTLIRDENVQVDTKAQSIDRESIVASKLAAIEFSDFERIRETNYTSTTPQPRSDDVRSWSVNQVSDWLIEQGFIKEADSFLQQDIDGACLMLLKRMDVLTDVGIKLGPAVKIFERIKRLQSACLSISDV